MNLWRTVIIQTIMPVKWENNPSNQIVQWLALEKRRKTVIKHLAFKIKIKSFKTDNTKKKLKINKLPFSIFLRRKFTVVFKRI